MLTPEQRTTLLTIARDSIKAGLDGRRPELRESDYDEILRRPAGAFVTLTSHGELRGCIGSIVAVEPLYRAVSSSALAAAFRDPRFDPLQSRELDDVELEISVMGPIERVTNIEEIEVGRDGLIISRGRNAGLLLPQVATDYRWDRDTFLDQTCVKAGLPPGTWRDPGTKIEKF
ncbi:MAG TPA: AmmeMemoRadiSam system protein A, partial [Thermoanaerobaculia bacterium]|nr:AmmeMemoRadiSam system protein A [Thermoanaerobaculia bacterium]